MNASTRIRLAVAIALIALVACKDDPVQRQTVDIGGGTKHDAGSGVTEDSGTLDASQGLDEDGGGAGPGGLVPGECLNVVAMNVINEDISADGVYNAITIPTDLAVTRVVGTWKASCLQPTIDIEMSEGSCPIGRRHKLVFSFEANAIEQGRVHLGENTLTADAKTVGIGVTYTRPTTLKPSGEFGTCPGVSGTIAIRGKPSVQVGSRLQGMFQVVLPPCDGGKGIPQSIIGTFNVKLVRGLAEVCPDP